MSTIYEIFGRDAHAMTIALMERAEVITAIPAGASVALKPNLVVAGQPEYGATTHAGVLSGAIEYLREHGVRDISIIEGSWVGDSTGGPSAPPDTTRWGSNTACPCMISRETKPARWTPPCGPWTSAAGRWTRGTSSICRCSRATARPA